MLVTLAREYRFEAAHQLPHHAGKCAMMHGHSYRLRLVIMGPIRDDGMILDFDEVDALAEPVITAYDHHNLNDIIENPTCELVALDAFTRLRSAGLNVAEVTLWETERGSVTVRTERELPAAGASSAG